MTEAPSGKTTPRVLCTRRLTAGTLRGLAESFDLDLHDSELPMQRDELLQRAHGVDGILTMLNDRVDAELLDAAGPQLRIVANFAVGLDNVDIDAATTRGVLVSNTPGAVTRPTAELAIALTLALLRRVAEGDRRLRRGDPWEWTPTWMLGSALAGRTFGVVGYGRIGREVARLARAFEMGVVYTRPGGPLDGEPGWLSHDELLARADVVSLHCPLNDDTRHLIDWDALSLMKPSAVLVNTSRGPVVREQALVEGLREGAIAGAALDVFEFEPAVTAELLDLQNVVVTPHLGSGTWEAREEMGALCVSALEAVLLRDVRPDNAVNVPDLRAVST
ncbi:MAG: D-glycerate dehydrogenase [Actinomycetota bacterium]